MRNAELKNKYIYIFLDIFSRSRKINSKLKNVTFERQEGMFYLTYPNQVYFKKNASRM